MTQECLYTLAVRRSFVFIKDNLFDDYLLDELIQEQLISDREKDYYVCESPSRYVWIEKIVKLMIIKKECKRFVEIISKTRGAEHIYQHIQDTRQQIESKGLSTANLLYEQPELTVAYGSLQKHFTLLYMELEPHKIADKMLQSGHLSTFYHDAVTKYPTKFKRLKKFLHIIGQKELCCPFICTLQNLEYTNVLDILKEKKQWNASTCKYAVCIKQNFTLLQKELPSDANIIVENLLGFLDDRDLFDIKLAPPTHRKSKLLKILLNKGKDTCQELLRVIEVELRRGDLIQTMNERSAYLNKTGKSVLSGVEEKICVSRLQENIEVLQENLDPAYICDLLLEESAIDITVHDKIAETNDCQKQIDYLLDTLTKNENNSLYSFLYILEKEKFNSILDAFTRPRLHAFSGKPVLGGIVERICVSCIQENIQVVHENLDPVYICDLLLKASAIDITVHDKIAETNDCQRQIEHLLDTLTKNENNCLHSFLNILEKEECNSILDAFTRPRLHAFSDGNIGWTLNHNVILEPDYVENESVQLRMSSTASPDVEQTIYQRFITYLTRIKGVVKEIGKMAIESIDLGSILLQLRPLTDQAVQTLLNAKDNNSLLEMINGMLKQVNISEFLDASKPLHIKVQVCYASQTKPKQDGRTSKSAVIKRKIKAYKNILVSELEPTTLVTILSKCEDFPQKSLEEILSAPNCHKKTERLLALIDTGDSRMVDVFVSVLRNLGYCNIAELIDPADLYSKAEKIRRKIKYNYENILDKMQITLARETISSCIGDVEAVNSYILPQNGTRRMRMNNFLLFILQEDHNVLEFEKVMMNNGLESLLEIKENMEDWDKETKNTDLRLIKDHTQDSTSEAVLFESIITLTCTDQAFTPAPNIATDFIDDKFLSKGKDEEPSHELQHKKIFDINEEKVVPYKVNVLRKESSFVEKDSENERFQCVNIKDHGERCSLQATRCCKICECRMLFCEDCAYLHTRRKAIKDGEMHAFDDLGQLSYFKGSTSMETECENDKIPGKPFAIEIKSDSVTLIWEAPVRKVDRFQIRFKLSIADSTWKIADNDAEINCITIRGLMAKTGYAFQVRAVYGDQEGQYGPCSDEIETKTSLATTLLDSCKCLNPGSSPRKYFLALNDDTMSRNTKARTRQLILGKPEKDFCPEKTIMLVGSTGSGKTTLVDSIVNYIMGVTFEDPFRFTVDTLEDKVTSKTDWITLYKIHQKEGSRLDYTLNIVDTPGFGGTRRIEGISAIVDQIRHLFSTKGSQGVLFLDAVCFVVKAPDACLTVMQKHMLSEIMSLFGSDVQSNICILITFAGDAKPPILTSLKQEKLSVDKTFEFNNSVLFAENERTNDYSSPKFWDMGIKSFERLFENISHSEAKSLSQPKNILDEREQLKTIFSNIRTQLMGRLSKLFEMKQELQIIKSHEKQRGVDQDFEYNVEETRLRMIEKPKGRHVTNCVICNVTCHEDCKIERDDEKMKCVAMNENTGKCKICAGNCMWNMHKDFPFIIKYVTETVSKTYAEVKEMGGWAMGNKPTNENHVHRRAEDIEKLSEEIFDMIKEMNDCRTRLNEIAFRPDPLTEIAYIDLMIHWENANKQPGYSNRVKMLEDIKIKAMSK